jgi:hypothetical protein
MPVPGALPCLRRHLCQVGKLAPFVRWQAHGAPAPNRHTNHAHLPFLCVDAHACLFLERMIALHGRASRVANSPGTAEHLSHVFLNFRRPLDFRALEGAAFRARGHVSDS